MPLTQARRQASAAGIEGGLDAARVDQPAIEELILPLLCGNLEDALDDACAIHEQSIQALDTKKRMTNRKTFRNSPHISGFLHWSCRAFRVVDAERERPHDEAMMQELTRLLNRMNHHYHV